MKRIDGHIETLAQYTSTIDKGVTRIVYTEEDKKAKAYLKKLMEELSLAIHEDQIGNIFGVWEGSAPNLPQVWVGSHSDAPTNGGKFDGVVGLIAALESIRILKSQGFQPVCDIVVVIFAAEEPTRFGIGCIGSRALLGMIKESDFDSWVDETNRTLREVLLENNKDPVRVLDESLKPDRIKSFVELHIEQAVVLEREKAVIGLVDVIAAPTEIQLVIHGEQRHAGSTPMDLRKDPVPAASEVVLLVEELTKQNSTSVGTVGKMTIKPGTSNVIAEKVELSIDIRDINKEIKDSIVLKMKQEVSKIMAKRGLFYNWEVKGDDFPSKMDEANLQVIQQITERLELPYKVMPSGAYHDALIMSRKVRTNLIFVPSKEGISHAPEEFTSTEEITSGIKVLTEFLKELSYS
ncbi:M20 family metallo-hydrolase [Halalkalibacter alkaliphilus]|uniref:M20 family metallo-hydrolase n=1 Tax=Halalkalibacter alkaliphilus TaxID=2917993 RepID=A0A9X2CXA3_9BACI|nr:M20 family metallo-hydrolase [Halalkalibacter alkaliphilus]MCL7749971.1 M20 family metallo-hydrolase [Halalkalibacter alkaliphilus]